MTPQSTQQLDTVVDLQRSLDDLRTAERRLHGIPEWMQELHEEHSARQTEIDALRAAVEDAARDRRQAEASVQDAQEKLKHFQEQISLVRTQREYGALLQEIDTVKRQIKESEDQALAALERQEEAQRQLDEQAAAFQDLDTRYRAELGKWEAEKPGVARQVEELRARIAELRERLSPAVQSHYERIATRHGGDALAAARRVDRPGRGPQMWACAACNYRVRPQVVVEILNNGSLVQCDSCKRILFVEGGA